MYCYWILEQYHGNCYQLIPWKWNSAVGSNLICRTEDHDDYLGCFRNIGKSDYYRHVHTSTRMDQFFYHCTVLHEILYWMLLPKYIEKIHICLQSDDIRGISLENLSMLLLICRRIISGMRNITDKSFRKLWNKTFRVKYICSANLAFCEMTMVLTAEPVGP
jgi:hypothetical protein